MYYNMPGVNPMAGMFGMYNPWAQKPQQPKSIGDIVTELRYIEVQLGPNQIEYRITGYIEDTLVFMEDGFLMTIAALISKHFMERPQYPNFSIKVEVDKADLNAYQIVRPIEKNKELLFGPKMVQSGVLEWVHQADSHPIAISHSRLDSRLFERDTLRSMMGKRLAELEVNVKDPLQVARFLEDEGYYRLSVPNRWVYQLNPMAFIYAFMTPGSKLAKYMQRIYGKINKPAESLEKTGTNFDKTTTATVQKMMWEEMVKTYQTQQNVAKEAKAANPDSETQEAPKPKAPAQPNMMQQMMQMMMMQQMMGVMNKKK